MSLIPSIGLDASWLAGVYLAYHQGIPWGAGLLYTFGPLGFLEYPRMYFGPEALAAFLFLAGAEVALALAVLWAMRRSVPLWAALAGAWLVLRLAAVSPSQLMAAALLIWAVAQARSSASPVRLTVLGVAAGLSLLVKFNDGVLMVAIAAAVICTASSVRWRFRVLALGGIALGLAAGWVASGQALPGIFAWLFGSVQIASGYSGAMGLEVAGREWEYLPAGVLLAAIGTIAWRSTAGWRVDARIGTLAAVAAFAFETFKYGFVRHDAHSTGFFSLALFPIIAFLPDRGSRGLKGAALALAVITQVAIQPLGTTLNPITGPPALFAEATILASKSARASALDAGLQVVRSHLQVDDQTLAVLHGHRVHIDAWETEAAWAYVDDFTWDPIPVFQTFSAYAPALDRLNAEHLVAPDGPDRILRQVPYAIDGRNPFWESPRYMFAMVCNFREVRATPAWEVLARTRSRCGSPTLINEETVPWGSTVTVPTAGGSLVYMELSLVGQNPVVPVRTALYKSDELWMTIDGTGPYRAVRVVSANLGEPTLLRVPGGAGFSGNFAVNPDVVSFDFGVSSAGPLASKIHVRFYAVPYS